ncbi:MAG: hypothetical protein ACTSXQ_07790 [Alphaproteobacteria bacterium]
MWENKRNRKRRAKKDRIILKKAVTFSAVGHFVLALILFFSIPLPKLPPLDMEYIISAEIVTLADVPNLPKKNKKKTAKKSINKTNNAEENKNVIKISDPTKKKNPSNESPPKSIVKEPLVISDDDAPPPAMVVKKKKMTVQEIEEDDEFLKSVKKVIKKEEENTESIQNNSADYDIRKILSISEVIALRQQLESCWTIPIGAKDAENLIVELKVFMNSDATVKHVEILDKKRMNKDPFFRTAAENARRAVKNPSCSPLTLPTNKYEKWKVMTLIFNPKEILSP